MMTEPPTTIFTMKIPGGMLLITKLKSGYRFNKQKTELEELGYFIREDGTKSYELHMAHSVLSDKAEPKVNKKRTSDTHGKATNKNVKQAEKKGKSSGTADSDVSQEI